VNNFFPYQTPAWLPRIFPQFTWHKHDAENEIYITFDDGPVPEATPVILQYLKEYNARATFFCVGENISRYPEIFRKLVEEGHSAGNHTYHHLNGWKTSQREYLDDVADCQKVLDPIYSRKGKPLMRPPYGRIKRKQWRALVGQYQIVMWDVLSGDFSNSVSTSTCLNKSIRYSKPGSIVLFHDSLKTIDKLRIVLPGFLKHFSQLGYSFPPL
jgi:peptidoglycan/xylan/chitin deacetylase (PgdA/CDA1 family)